MSHKPMRVIARVPNVACPNAAEAMTNRFMVVGKVHETMHDFPYVVSLLKSGEVWPADEETAIRASDRRVIERWLAVKPHVDRLIQAQKAAEEKAAAEAKKAAEQAESDAKKADEDAKKALAEQADALGALIAPQAAAEPPKQAPAPKTPSPKAGE